MAERACIAAIVADEREDTLEDPTLSYSERHGADFLKIGRNSVAERECPHAATSHERCRDDPSSPGGSR
jgi:hypothetical protein